MRFNSPTVNLRIKPDVYIKLLRDLRHYMTCNLTVTREPGISFPIGVLENIRIYFTHYSTDEEAKAKWIERESRIRYANLFIMVYGS